MMDKCPPTSDTQLNRTNAARTASYYDELWPSLGRRLDYTETNRVRFITDSIRRYVKVPRPRILDLGCGRGWMAPFLSELGTATGVDFSPVGIEFARENYGSHATFHLADPDSPTLGLPQDARFDVVVNSEVIEHVPEPSALLGQIASLLVPGGWCMMTTPNGNIWPQFRVHPTFAPDLQPVENWLTPKQLATAFRRAGFRVARHEGRPVYGFRLGLAGRLQHPTVETICRRLGLAGLHARLILRTSVYQLVAAQKRSQEGA